MTDTETFTNRLDNAIAELNVLLNENDGTLKIGNGTLKKII